MKSDELDAFFFRYFFLCFSYRGFRPEQHLGPVASCLWICPVLAGFMTCVVCLSTLWVFVFGIVTRAGLSELDLLAVDDYLILLVTSLQPSEFRFHCLGAKKKM